MIIKENINNGPGGAIASNFGSKISITESEIIENTGASLGGGIVNFSLEDGSVYIKNSKVNRNKLTNGQTVAQTFATFVKTIEERLSSEQNNSNVTKNIKYNDTLTKIAGLIQVTSDKLSALRCSKINFKNLIAGGAVATLFCDLNIHESEFYKNYIVVIKKDTNIPIIGAGGAIFSNHHLYLKKSCIKRNKVTGVGGGIFCAGETKLLKSEIIKNKVVEKHYVVPDTHYYGGGVYDLGKLKICNCEIKHNKAKKWRNVYDAQKDK